ncbi:MAG TPA: hypothetical protein VJO33_05815 [Gemmatimonadaceae bacterium]|nr:hypothetical protein [Gemmatimonadaceae bacterium]
MNHRHLLPTEIDLLLDDEEGFGVAPLKAHVRSCPDCLARLEDARLVTDSIEELAHFAPAFSFADSVMAQVPVFVPWHVAARDSVISWMPESRPARVAAIGLAASVASVLTVAILWIASQTDLLVFATGMAGSQLRELLVDGGRNALMTLFGSQTLALASQAGMLGMSLLFGGFLAIAATATFGLRRMAIVSSRRRA